MILSSIAKLSAANCRLGNKPGFSGDHGTKAQTYAKAIMKPAFPRLFCVLEEQTDPVEGVIRIARPSIPLISILC
jgi:hypothetical protein